MIQQSTTGYLPKGDKITILKRSAPHVYCSIIHSRQDMETTSVSVDGWLGNENVVHTYNEILFNLKEEGNPDICINIMNLEDITLSGISQTQRDKYCMIPLTCGSEKVKLRSRE